MIRLFDPARDILPLLRLFNELEALDHDPEPSTEESIRSQLNWRGHHPATDRWVVEKSDDPEVFIGHGWIFQQSDQRSALKVTIHPDYRRCGLGSTLLGRILVRAQEIGAPVVVSGADAQDCASVAFLEKHGFVAVSSNWFLRIPASHDLPLPIWPEGYSVRRYNEISDPAALAHLLNAAYGDQAGHREHSQPITGADVDEAFASCRWDPETLFVALAPDGQWAGVCQLKINGRDVNQSGVDILDAPGIARQYRDQGLIRPLILAAMDWQRTTSSGDTVLESYGEATIAIYEDIGFTLQQRFIEFERRLSQ